MQKEANAELEKMISNGGRKKKTTEVLLNSISTNKQEERIPSERSIRSTARGVEISSGRGGINNGTNRHKSTV